MANLLEKRIWDFNPTQARWDQYRMHYNVLASNVVLFETGEMIYTHAHPDPDQRHEHKNLGIEILTQEDPTHAGVFTTPDGKEIKKSYFGSSKVYMAMDIPTGRCVQLSPWDDKKWRQGTPEHLDKHNVAAYWGGSKRNVQGGAITIKWPRVLTNEQRKHLTDLVDASRAWVGLTDPDRKVKTLAGSVDGVKLLEQAFAEVPEEIRRQLVYNGYFLPKVPVQYDHLIFKPTRA